MALAFEEENMTRVSKATFVSAIPRDLNRVVALIKKYYRFEGIPFNRSLVENGVKTLLTGRSLGSVWMIRIGKAVAGYCILTYGYDIEFGGRIGTVTDLYIVPKYRRCGLGRKTLEFIEATCLKKGFRALELQVTRGNIRARKFYRALGFTGHDRIPQSKEL